eukprot:COSAG02_NODE_156_length_33065_cov_17.208336_17_plen_90_part_00
MYDQPCDACARDNSVHEWSVQPVSWQSLHVDCVRRRVLNSVSTAEVSCALRSTNARALVAATWNLHRHLAVQDTVLVGAARQPHGRCAH